MSRAVRGERAALFVCVRSFPFSYQSLYTTAGGRNADLKMERSGAGVNPVMSWLNGTEMPNQLFFYAVHRDGGMLVSSAMVGATPTHGNLWVWCNSSTSGFDPERRGAEPCIRAMR